MIKITDVELTPNPHALKFILSEKILNYETRQYQNSKEAENDPLAAGIFNLPGVVSVFYMDRFITVEKTKETQWGQIQRALVPFIENFDFAQLPPEKELKELDENASELMIKINEVLNQKVRPALAYDGGGLEILGLDGHTLKIRYQGACGSCPTSIKGTLTAIESLLKRDVSPLINVTPG